RRIRTGATTSCFTSTFMETTGPDWAPATRRGGPGPLPGSSISLGRSHRSRCSKGARRAILKSPPKQPVQLRRPPLDPAGQSARARRRHAGCLTFYKETNRMGTPRYPSLYQINTRVWLTELSCTLGRCATLDDIPDASLDRLAARGFDWIW